MTVKTLALPSEAHSSGRLKIRALLRTMWRQRWLYFLMTPTLIYFVIFKYVPLWNAQIAFKDFKPLLGVWGSPWAGFKHFETFINSFYFTDLLTNTIIFSVAKLILGLPLAVVCAVALHETWFLRYRTFVQTMIYLPHFLSWVIMYGVLLVLLSPGNGLFNEIIQAFGGEPIAFLASPAHFRWVVILSDIWKETGWSTILYLAALLAMWTFVSASAWMGNTSPRIWYISLPESCRDRPGYAVKQGIFPRLADLCAIPCPYSVGDIICRLFRRACCNPVNITAVGFFRKRSVSCWSCFNRIAKRWAQQSIY
jgi:putative aldouronate transport system permease protein